MHGGEELAPAQSEVEEQELFTRLKAEAIKVNDEAQFVEELEKNGDPVFTVGCESDEWYEDFEGPHVVEEPAEEAANNPDAQEMSEVGSITDSSFECALDGHDTRSSTPPAKDNLAVFAIGEDEAGSDKESSAKGVAEKTTTTHRTATLTLSDELEAAEEVASKAFEEPVAKEALVEEAAAVQTAWKSVSNGLQAADEDEVDEDLA